MKFIYKFVGLILDYKIKSGDDAKGIRLCVQRLTYRDFLPIQDYIETLYRDEWLMRERRSELKLDKIKALFYEIKLRYDIIYARKNHTDRNGVKEDHEYFEVIDQLFAEYCRRIYTQIKGVLYPLKCKIEWAKIGKYNAFFEFLTEKEGRARRLANILRNSRIL